MDIYDVPWEELDPLKVSRVVGFLDAFKQKPQAKAEFFKAVRASGLLLSDYQHVLQQHGALGDLENGTILWSIALGKPKLVRALLSWALDESLSRCMDEVLLGILERLKRLFKEELND